MVIAEREQHVDNADFTNMAAVVVLRATVRLAGRLGLACDPQWERIAQGMWLPRRGQAIVSHDRFRFDEEKGYSKRWFVQLGWKGGIAMSRTFACFIEDRRYSVPTLRFLETDGDAASLRERVRRELLSSGKSSGHRSARRRRRGHPAGNARHAIFGPALDRQLGLNLGRTRP